MSIETLSFIRRRPPHPVVKTVQQATTLTLSASMKEKDSADKHLAPLAWDVRQLEEANPFVCLNAYQSSIGSLLLKFSAAVSYHVAWELVDGSVGSLNDVPHDAGRREIVSVDRRDSQALIVGLKHVRNLRRLVFSFSDSPDLTVVTSSQRELKVHPHLRTLEMYCLDGQLYFRYDENIYSSDHDLRVAYGM